MVWTFLFSALYSDKSSSLQKEVCMRKNRQHTNCDNAFCPRCRSVRESLENHVLTIIVRAEEQKDITTWNAAKNRLLEFSPQELENLLNGLQNRGLLRVIKDPEQNFLLSSTEEGRQHIVIKDLKQGAIAIMITMIIVITLLYLSQIDWPCAQAIRDFCSAFFP